MTIDPDQDLIAFFADLEQADAAIAPRFEDVHPGSRSRSASRSSFAAAGFALLMVVGLSLAWFSKRGTDRPAKALQRVDRLCEQILEAEAKPTFADWRAPSDALADF